MIMFKKIFRLIFFFHFSWFYLTTNELILQFDQIKNMTF